EAVPAGSICFAGEAGPWYRIEPDPVCEASVPEERLPVAVGQRVVERIYQVLMSLKLVWLSHRLGIDDPRPPAIPAPQVSDLYTIEKDGANVQILRLASHTATHLDSPRQVIPDGLVIGDFGPQELVFTRPVVVDLRRPDA